VGGDPAWKRTGRLDGGAALMHEVSGVTAAMYVAHPFYKTLPY